MDQVINGNYESDEEIEDDVGSLASDDSSVGPSAQEISEAQERRKMYNVSCDTIRKKINILLGSKEMTQASFLEMIGNVGSSSFHRFMSYKGANRGGQNSTFFGAAKYFFNRDKAEKEKRQNEKKAAQETLKEEKRKAKELIKQMKEQNKGQNKRRLSDTSVETNPDEDVDEPEKKSQRLDTSNTEPAPSVILKPLAPAKLSKQQKLDAEQKLFSDVLAVRLPDNRVMDDCDVVRTNIAKFLKEENIPLARFAKALGLSTKPFNNFLATKGWNQGAGYMAYPAAYYFFEKLRILRNIPKNSHRKLAEKEHPQGYKTEDQNKVKFYYIEGITPSYVLQRTIAHHNDPHHDQFA